MYANWKMGVYGIRSRDLNANAWLLMISVYEIINVVFFLKFMEYDSYYVDYDCLRWYGLYFMQ